MVEIPSLLEQVCDELPCPTRSRVFDKRMARIEAAGKVPERGPVARLPRRKRLRGR